MRRRRSRRGERKRRAKRQRFERLINHTALMMKHHFGAHFQAWCIGDTGWLDERIGKKRMKRRRAGAKQAR